MEYKNGYSTIKGTYDMANHTISDNLFAQFTIHFSSSLYNVLAVYNIVGMCFNTMLIIYFVKTGKSRIPTFTLLTSLAAMDFVCCLTGVVLSTLIFPTMIITKPRALGQAICSFFAVISTIGTVGSEYHLIFFAIFRFYQLASPLSARARITSNFVIKGCILLIASVVILNIHFMYNHHLDPIILNGSSASLCSRLSCNTILWVVETTVIPCVALPLLHIAKYLVIAHNQNASAVRGIKDAAVKYNTREIKNTDARAVTLVIILFLFAWLPSSIYISIRQAQKNNYSITADEIYIALLFVTLSNSTVNPIIYCLAAKSVRDDILKRICRRKSK